MKIVVDAPKRRSNMAKHGIDLYDAEIFDWRGCIVVSARSGRSKAIGKLGDTIAAIIFKPLGSEGLSIISIRPASCKERAVHDQR